MLSPHWGSYPSKYYCDHQLQSLWCHQFFVILLIRLKYHWCLQMYQQLHNNKWDILQTSCWLIFQGRTDVIDPAPLCRTSKVTW
jgi:hypothetical protein